MQTTSISFEALPITAMTVVMAAYAAMLLCVIVVELHPGGRLARVAAISSILLASTGGAAWSYAAFYQKSHWPEFATSSPVAREDASPTRYFGRRGRETDPEAEDDDAGGDGENGRGNNRGGSGKSSGSGGALGDISLVQILGLANRAEVPASDTIVDCDGCPPMVMVPPGSVRIGAPDSDRDATAAERPQRDARFWPGYMISIDPVSAQSFREFMLETNRRVWSCGPQIGSLDVMSVGSVPGGDYAGCVMPGDADAYAAWLTARTGKVFRLPKASEWEYAARMLSADVMRRGQVSELVGDCWHATLPKPGTERIAAQASMLDCDGRTIMAAKFEISAAGDAEPKLRLSARSKLAAGETHANVGFRVMRPTNSGR